MIEYEEKMEVVRTALKKMYDGYFCISTFKECAELMNITVPDETLKFLHPLHCIYFNTMSKKLRKRVIELIVQTFSAENVTLEKHIIEMMGREIEGGIFFPELQDKEKKRRFLFSNWGGNK